MKIPFFKNREVIIKPFKLSEKVKSNINHELLISLLEKRLSGIFILEQDIDHDEINKIILIKNNEYSHILFFLNNSTVSIKESALSFPNTNESFINLYNNNDYKSIKLNPYKLDILIKAMINRILRDISSKNMKLASEYIDETIKTSFIFKSFFKSDSKNVINYIKNVCFNSFDKELFKECYPFTLHADTNNTDFYNLLANNKNVRDNFIKFKKDNSFLSMAFIKAKPSRINLLFENSYSEDKIYNNIRNYFKKSYKFITNEQFEYLKRKSYNHFLYIKTPDKYFKFIEKSGLHNLKSLSLKQLNFLNKVYHKNNTFLTEPQILEIINNEELMNRFIRVFEFRKYLCRDIKAKFNNIEEFLIENENAYLIAVEKNVNSIIKSNLITDKSLILDDFFGKKIKLKSGDVNLFLSDLKNHVSNEKFYYNNSTYIVDAVQQLNRNDKNLVLLELKEGRQKHAILINYDEYNNKLFFSQNCTPRIKKIMKLLIEEPLFKNYYFDNFIFITK